MVVAVFMWQIYYNIILLSMYLCLNIKCLAQYRY